MTDFMADAEHAFFRCARPNSRSRPCPRKRRMNPSSTQGPQPVQTWCSSLRPTSDGGLAITDVPECWRARWDDNLSPSASRTASASNSSCPSRRWRGFGGKNHVREWSFETFTSAAGLAAVTKNIGLFATVHVPLVHPVYAAKALGHGGPHQRRPRRPQHRLRLEPAGIPDVRRQASATMRYGQAGRVGRDHRALLRRRTVRPSTSMAVFGST